MRFSIITPSFRSSDWLKLCVPSVADQNVDLEHIVQDACSDDDTQDWLPKDPRVKAFIEKDKGMYDAVNRGLRRSSGEILAYINCDEQYLPGALRMVNDFFDRNPGIDVAFADMVVIRGDGEYVCHRKAVIPGKYHCWVGGALAVFTCSMFFRRRILERNEMFFSEKLRDLGDIEWVMRLLKQRIPMGILPEITSAFTETGVNMNLLPNALREKAELLASAPLWARKLRHAVKAHHWVKRRMARGGSESPFSYSVYTPDSLAKRKNCQVLRPTTKWVR